MSDRVLRVANSSGFYGCPSIVALARWRPLTQARPRLMPARLRVAAGTPASRHAV